MTQLRRKARSALLTACLCAFGTSPAVAEDTLGAAAMIGADTVGAIGPVLGHETSPVPFPLALTEATNQPRLAFDTAGSEQRRLRIDAGESFALNLQGGSWLTLDGAGAEGGARFNWLAPGGFSFGGGLGGSESRIPFQTLGAIQCEGGVLTPGSYRASDCRFVNDNRITSQRADFAAEYRAPWGLSSRLGVFRQANQSELAAGRGFMTAGTAPVFDARSLAPTLTHPLLAATSVNQPLTAIDSEVTGVDLEFALGVATDNAGDMRFGLQLTRVMDAQWQGESWLGGGNPLAWSLAEPYDTATLNVDWRIGSFSGGVQSFYRDQVEFLNRADIDSLTTFDVHFTWRAPWNASFSVGASNITNAGVDDAAEAAASDPFESVFGRIPYVRYKQDL